MPKRDSIHDIVKVALEKDGWKITPDPFTIATADSGEIHIDLAAERILAAEKGDDKIAVEIKTLVGKSLITEFYSALGKYQLYEVAIEEATINRVLYLAMPELIYQKAWKHSLIRGSIIKYGIKVIVIDLDTEKITQWIK